MALRREQALAGVQLAAAADGLGQVIGQVDAVQPVGQGGIKWCAGGQLIQQPWPVVSRASAGGQLAIHQGQRGGRNVLAVCGTGIEPLAQHGFQRGLPLWRNLYRLP
jgi:hypothetical protein